MTPQLFLEITDAAELAHWEEWACREYAWANNVAFPIPDDPPGVGFTYYYLRGEPLAGGGGVVKLDDDIMAFASSTRTHTLNDATEYSYDLAANAIEAEALSPEAHAIMFPVPPEQQ